MIKLKARVSSRLVRFSDKYASGAQLSQPKP
jgi:hypothetical protein